MFLDVVLQYNSVGNDTGSDDDNADYTPEVSSGPETPQTLKRLRSKTQPRGTREKIKVDRDDLVMDVDSFHKSPDFYPTIPIFVSLKGQPAIDTGGVLWQVFSDVFIPWRTTRELRMFLMVTNITKYLHSVMNWS